MKFQRCYGNVRYLDGLGPCPRNVELLDHNARPLIHKMSTAGMQVELEHFLRMDRVLTDDMDQITEEVRSLTGHYINIGSGDQVSDLLFKKLGIKQARRKMTKSGDRESVEEEVLTAIQHEHPAVSLCMNYKEVEKLRGTYVRPMPKLAVRVSQGNWRMFPKLGQTRIPSGRLNCKEPNLLAMPTRTERGKEIRKGFIAPDGWSYVSVDESQIEVRVAAHRSKDANLIKIYLNKEDIYSDFAINAFKLKDNRYQDEKGKWKYPSVHPDNHRFPAKTCVLASIYDVTAPGLLEQMPVVCARCSLQSKHHTDKERAKAKASDKAVACHNFSSLWTENKCQDLINAFYMRYPGLMRMRKSDHGRARKWGMVWDDWGRIQHAAGVKSVLEWVVSATLREVANTPIQGTAQGTVKVTMWEVFRLLTLYKLWEVVVPQLQIHDELLFCCRNDVAEEWGQMVADLFERCVTMLVPIKAGVATAQTWGDLEK